MTKKLIEIWHCQAVKRLNIRVRRHIDHMFGTRNFNALNERIERGVLAKSHEGKNVSADCHQWKANGCSFILCYFAGADSD